MKHQSHSVILDKLERISALADATAAGEYAAFAPPSDPFGLDDPCPENPGGHVVSFSCGHGACLECGKVVW